MEAFGKFILTIALGFGNLFLGYWAMGHIIGHWDLQETYGVLLNFKNYWGTAYVVSIFMVGSIGRTIWHDVAEGLDKKYPYKNIQSQLFAAVAILISTGFSYLWTSIFFN